MNVVIAILTGLGTLFLARVGINPDKHLRPGLHRLVKELIALVALVFYALSATACLSLLWTLEFADGTGWIVMLGFFLGGVGCRIWDAIKKSDDEVCRTCDKCQEKPEEE